MGLCLGEEPPKGQFGEFVEATLVQQADFLTFHAADRNQAPPVSAAFLTALL